jgi:hypothetical protein
MSHVASMHLKFFYVKDSRTRAECIDGTKCAEIRRSMNNIACYSLYSTHVTKFQYFGWSLVAACLIY